MSVCAFIRRLEERLAEQARPVWAFFYQFSRFRLDARVLRSHRFFTFKERVHVPKRNVRIFFCTASESSDRVPQQIRATIRIPGSSDETGSPSRRVPRYMTNH